MERSKKMIKTGIIGAGNIACLYDGATDEYVLTHAHAITESEDFELVGFYDSDNLKSKAAAERWQGRCFMDIVEMLSQIDVAIVSVSDQYHYSVIQECLRYDNLKALIVEKPLVSSAQQGNELALTLRRHRMPLFVNYSRRYMEEFRVMKEVISKSIGQFRCGSCYYGKGTLHNGSHLIDLMMYLFGELQTDYVGKTEFDFFEEDPSIEFALRLKGGNSLIFFHPIPCGEVTVLEFDLLFSNLRIRYSDENQEIEYSNVARKNLMFDEHNYTAVQTVHLDISHAMRGLYENVRNTILGFDYARCNEEDGMRVMEIVENIRKKRG